MPSGNCHLKKSPIRSLVLIENTYLPRSLFKHCADKSLTFAVEFLLAVVESLSKAPRIVTDHPRHKQSLPLQVTPKISKCFDDRLLVRHVPPHFIGYLTSQNEQETLIDYQQCGELPDQMVRRRTSAVMLDIVLVLR